MKKTYCCFMMISGLSLIFCQSIMGADLETAYTEPQAGQVFSITFSVSSAPNTVFAFGFDVSYDAAKLQYKSYSFSGSLAENFEFLQVNPFSSGVIRIGGMDPGDNVIAQNTSGMLVNLTFEIIDIGGSQIQILNLIDDMAAWTVADAQLIAKDAYEPDNFHHQSGVIDKLQHHNFHEAGDSDWGKIYGTAGKTYTLRTANLEANCDTVIELYDFNGQTLIQSKNDFGAGEDESLTWNCPQDTVYFVKIRNSNANIFGDGTAYELSVEYPPLFDAYEPDNTSNQARIIVPDFRPQTHGLLTEEDEDWVQFEASVGEIFSIEMTPLNSCDIAVELYGMDSSSVRRSGGVWKMLKRTVSSGAENLVSMNWQCAEDGTYYIRFSKTDISTRRMSRRTDECNYECQVRRDAVKINSKISGCVQIATGEPIEGANVTADITGGIPLTSKTDICGIYYFASVYSYGGYLLKAAKPGYLTTAYIENSISVEGLEYPIQVENNNEVHTINIEMEQCLGNTDDSDPDITSGDALVAYYAFLKKQPTYKEVCCDVNKDGRCTPEDAHCIFRKYMGYIDTCLD